MALGRATSAAWTHAVIVACFPVLPPLRLRAVSRGSGQGLHTIGIIAGVLLAVIVVEAAISGLLPSWMRVEMIGIAVLMLAIVVCVRQMR